MAVMGVIMFIKDGKQSLRVMLWKVVSWLARFSSLSSEIGPILC